jgi:hypothetical protein
MARAMKGKPANKTGAVQATRPVTAQKNAGMAKRKARSGPTRNFPRYGLEDCYNLANAIRAFNAGNPWSPREIAAALNSGVGDKFFYLTAAARDYGITVGTRESTKIELTDLGRNLVYQKRQPNFLGRW